VLMWVHPSTYLEGRALIEARAKACGVLVAPLPHPLSRLELRGLKSKSVLRTVLGMHSSSQVRFSSH
jgi:hypothetical protein